MSKKAIVMEHTEYEDFDSTSIGIGKSVKEWDHEQKCKVFVTMAKQLSSELDLEVQLGISCYDCNCRNSCGETRDEFDFWED